MPFFNDVKATFGIGIGPGWKTTLSANISTYVYVIGGIAVGIDAAIKGSMDGDFTLAISGAAFAVDKIAEIAGRRAAQDKTFEGEPTASRAVVTDEGLPKSVVLKD